MMYVCDIWNEEFDVIVLIGMFVDYISLVLFM